MRVVILDHETRRSSLALSGAGSHDKATGPLAAWFAVVLLARVCRDPTPQFTLRPSRSFASVEALMLVHMNVFACECQRQREPLHSSFACFVSNCLISRFTCARAMVDHLRVQSGEVGLPRRRIQADRSSPQPPKHADSATHDDAAPPSSWLSRVSSS